VPGWIALKDNHFKLERLALIGKEGNLILNVLENGVVGTTVWRTDAYLSAGIAAAATGQFIIYIS
jgi:hypothetical protein